MKSVRFPGCEVPCKSWFLIVGFLLATLCKAESSDAVAKDTFRILSWNVMNYTLTDRLVNGRFCRDYPKPESEKTAIRNVIHEQRPDLMFFQEVGGNAFLRELSDDLRSEFDLEYPYFTTVVVEDEVRKLGVMSRLPFQEVVNPITEVARIEYLGALIQVKRGLLEVEVELDESTRMTCMTFHLKSRFTSDERDPGSSERREKEARTIRDYLREVMEREPGKRIVMMGDLNDAYGSQAYDRFTRVGERNVMCEIPLADANGESWTYYYKRARRYEQIDFLFVSPSIKDDPSWKISARILNGTPVLDASDHRPIVLDIRKTN